MDGVDMRLGRVQRMVGPEDGIRGIGTMRSGRRGADGGVRFRKRLHESFRTAFGNTSWSRGFDHRIMADGTVRKAPDTLMSRVCLMKHTKEARLSFNRWR